jgi:hypothetical protein
MQVESSMGSIDPECFHPADYDYYKEATKALEEGNRALFDNIYGIVSKRDTHTRKWMFFWNSFARHALSSGNFDLFIYIQSLAPKDYSWDWDYFGSTALQIGGEQLFNRIKKLPPDNRPLNWNIVIEGVFMTNESHTDMIKMFKSVQRNAPEYLWYWTQLAGKALANNNREMFDYIRSIAPPLYTWNWQTLGNDAVCSGDQAVFDYVRKLAPEKYMWNWTHLAAIAVRISNKRLFDYLCSLAPPGYNYDWTYIVKQATELQTYVRSIVPRDYDL